MVNEFNVELSDSINRIQSNLTVVNLKKAVGDSALLIGNEIAA